MIDVMCVVCGYETVLFEENYDADNGEPCPNCGSSEIAKLDSLFADHPIPYVDGSPGLLRTEESTQELQRDMEKLMPIAERHGVTNDV